MIKRRWTKIELKCLNDNILLTDYEISLILNRSINSICKKRNRLNILKDKSLLLKRLYKEGKRSKNFLINNNFAKGNKHTEKSKLLISISLKGEKNGMWKGDNIKSYVALHQWIRRNKPKIELCENCNKKESYDLANISGKYKRDIDDYKWLCRKCHMEEDGRILNLVSYR